MSPDHIIGHAIVQNVRISLPLTYFHLPPVIQVLRFTIIVGHSAELRGCVRA